MKRCEKIFVQKQYRQKGIGKELFELSKKIAKKSGAHVFQGDFSVKEETSDAGIAFFYAMGCEIRLERVPVYRLSLDAIEKALESKKITKTPKMEIHSFREMPEGVMSRFLKE